MTNREGRPPTTADFRIELKRVLNDAQERGESSIEVNSGELHRDIGWYPGSNHRMPACCGVMYKEKRDGDVIVAAPPKDKGANLTIRYRLPRPAR